MYTPILPPNYHMGMDFLVLSFVVVVVGGMGSLTGAVAAGFMLGILQSFASMNEIKSIVPGIDQIIIYLIAVVILLVRPRGLMGRKGVMESGHAVIDPTAGSDSDRGLRRGGADHADLAGTDRRRLSRPRAEVRHLRPLRHRLQHPVRVHRIPLLRPRRLPRRRLLRGGVVVQAVHHERAPGGAARHSAGRRLRRAARLQDRKSVV